MFVIKFLVFISLVISFFAVSTPLYLCNYYLKVDSKNLISKILSFYAGTCLALFGIRTTVNDLYDYKLTQTSFLIVSNHLSYIDILIIANTFPSYFITSLDMKGTLFLGHICQMAQCLFVNRKSRSNISHEIKNISKKLEQGENVVLFPEATSTDGSSVLPFKKSLFQAGIDSKASVLPICLNYLSINNESVDSLNRDKLCWYGAMSFFPHFIDLLKLKEISISMTIGMPIENLQNEDVKTLAAKTYRFINNHYTSIENEKCEKELSPVLPGNSIFGIETNTFQEA
jgi:1-acyl-sn-glycerol-3-phosphate acyltransferase